jgi:hypothetical protein
VVFVVALPQPASGAATQASRTARPMRTRRGGGVRVRGIVAAVPRTRRILRSAAIVEHLMAARASLRAAVLIALTVGAVAIWVAPASATPEIGCGKITVHHKRYSIRAHVLSCSRARSWSYGFLGTGRVPSGYDCQRFSPKITRIRFLCSDPSTATPRDGPRGFNATS